MKNPLPDLSGGQFNGSYFTINLHGADLGTDGVIRGSGNGITISATPVGLAVMMTKVREPALLALWKFLAEGRVALVNNLLRVEVSGWGVRWLKANGFSSSQAQIAIADLRDIGWIRVEEQVDFGLFGEQTGVLTGAVYGSGDVFLAPERKNPMPSAASGSSGHRPSLTGSFGQQASVFAQVSPLFESSGQRSRDEYAELTEPVDNLSGAPHLQGLTASGSSVHESPGRTSTELVQSQEVLQWHLVINEKPVLPRDVLLDALAEPALVAAIAADPQRAVTLIAGIFTAVEPDYPCAAATFVGLAGTNESITDAAERLSAQVVACLLLNSSTAYDQPVARLRAEIRSRGVYVKDSELPDALLPRAWAVALIHAGSTKMGDPKKYMHSALHRKEWKTGDALARFAGAICALTAAPLGADLVSHTQEQQPGDPELDLIIKVLTDHYHPHPDDLRAWQRNQRRRASIIAEFVAETGMTPQEAARTRAEQAAILAREPGGNTDGSAALPGTTANDCVDANTAVLLAAAIAGTRYDTEAGYQMVMDSPALRGHILSRQFRDTECADWDPVQNAHHVDRRQAETA